MTKLECSFYLQFRESLTKICQLLALLWGLKNSFNLDPDQFKSPLSASLVNLNSSITEVLMNWGWQLAKLLVVGRF